MTLHSYGLAHSDKFVFPHIWGQIFCNSFQESLSFGGQIEEKECCIKDVDHIPDGIDDAQIEDMAAAVYIQSSWG